MTVVSYKGEALQTVHWISFTQAFDNNSSYWDRESPVYKKRSTIQLQCSKRHAQFLNSRMSLPYSLNVPAFKAK